MKPASSTKICKELAPKGLILFAIDVGESKETVKKYLEQHPRDCKIVLMEDTNLAAMYQANSYPIYVVIDRDGFIAGIERGAGVKARYVGSLPAPASSLAKSQTRMPLRSRPRSNAITWTQKRNPKTEASKPTTDRPRGSYLCFLRDAIRPASDSSSPRSCSFIFDKNCRSRLRSWESRAEFPHSSRL